MLKWVPQFKSTSRNVSILLINEVSFDIQGHEQTVKDALINLESQSYLQRNGEVYEFLTDKEKDVEQEIKRVEIGDSQVIKQIHGVIFEDVLNSTGKARYEANNNDYKIAHKIDDALIKLGTGGDLRLYHDGSNSYVEGSGTGELRLRGRSVRITDHDGSESFGVFNDDGAVDLYFDNSKKFSTTLEGAQITGFTSTTAGLGVTGGMWEGAFIKAGKLSDNKTLGISTSNIFYFSTQETTTSTPNIIWNDTYPLSSKMKVGDAVTVTVISNAAAGGYSANWTIDGNAVSEQWNGGSAPSEGGSDGFDIYTLTIIRKATGTGDTGWIVFANVNNFT